MELNILQVSTYDIAGGAEKIAWNLHQYYLKKGYNAWLAVGKKRSNDKHVIEIPNLAWKSFWPRWILKSNAILFAGLTNHIRGIGRFQQAMKWLAEPRRYFKIFSGKEDFEFPGTWKLLNLLPKQPIILHCHNLHGGYFDLRALSWLSKKVPVILTLHDAWMLSGHCAHSFQCEKWKSGCGTCPDLLTFPSVRRDATAFNWECKRRIYLKSRFSIATPSDWLMRKVKQSIMTPAILESRIIPNGVDLVIFYPGRKEIARQALRIPQEIDLLLFVGNRIQTNPWKDYKTLKKALNFLKPDKKIWLLCLGEEGKNESIGNIEIKFKGYEQNPIHLANYYRAADIYVYPSKVDTFPNTILEALSCGTPVIATAVGGIPEQIKSLKSKNPSQVYIDSEFNTYSYNEATGILIPPGDSETMAFWIDRLLKNKIGLSCMSKNAALDGKKRFNMKNQAETYIEWYKDLIACLSREKIC